MDIKKLAETLDSAALHAKPITQLSLDNEISLKDAYKIQMHSINRRYERGEKFLGLKLGFTSKAKMEQMGIDSIIWGRLTTGMLLKRGGNLPMKKFIHPRAEPELCFLVKKAIDRELKVKEAKDYIFGVAPALEIIDSRYENFKFTLEDVIADNCSSAAFVLGGWMPLDKPINNLKMELVIDGEVVESGRSDAILGNPWESVVEVSKLVGKFKKPIPKGSYILAGAATPAAFIKEGNVVKVVVERLGEVEFTVAAP